MCSPLYRVTPLPTPDSIRLLKRTTDYSVSDNPSYSLSVFELQDIPAYCALSYTWGNPLPSEEGTDDENSWLKESHSINCQGFLVGVRPNLSEGLSSLAKLGFDDYIWVDALCIDQQSLSERNSQVSLMGKIYSKAAQVIVWLGKASTDAEGVVWLHNYFIPELRSRLKIEPDKFRHSDAVLDLDPAGCQNLGLDGPTYHAQAYADFCRRSWFSRAWIVQEIALASRIKVIVGSAVLAWMDVLSVAHFFQANRAGIGFFFKTKLGMPNPGVEPKLDVTRLREAQTLCREEARESNRIAFQQLAGLNTNAAVRASFLMWYANRNRICKCSDKRDKIYSTLGLLDQMFPPESEDERFYPKYENSVETVFSDAVCWSMRRAHLLLPLSFVEERSRRNIKNLPSWVPDFSSNPCPSVLALRGIYNAPGDHLSKDIVTVIDFPTLKTQAAPIDAIVATIPLNAQVVGGVEHILSFCANMDQPYHNGQNRLEALWRTMIADSCAVDGSMVYPASPSTVHSFRTWILSRVILCKARPLYPDAQALFLAIHGNFDRPGPIDVAVKQACGTLETLEATDEMPPDMPSLEDVKHLARFGDGYKIVSNPELKYPPGCVFENLLKRSTPFDEAFCSATDERCLYMTKQGCIGLGPLSTKPADQIWILQAAKVPFVLRPRDGHDRFELMGETFVHGFMNGEFIATGSFPGWTEVTIA